jgi:hypothetical protein
LGQEALPAADMAALREAVLGFYEESIGRLVAQRRGRTARRPPRRLHWLTFLLLLPWLLVGLVRTAVTRREPEVAVRQQRAVSLYRQLSGKDPTVARAELGRIYQQLMAIDQRGNPDDTRSGTAGVADRADLEAAAGALLAYHLGGRQTDDALLDQIQAAWVEYEAVGEERRERLLLQAQRGERGVRAQISRRERAAMARYLAGWRGWFARRTEQDGSPDRDD